MKTAITFKSLEWMPVTQRALLWFVTYRDTLDDVPSFRHYQQFVADDIISTLAFLNLLGERERDICDQLRVEIEIAGRLVLAIGEHIDALLAKKEQK